MNEEEAIEELKKHISLVNKDYAISDYCEKCGNIEAIGTVLNLLEKKDKIIDLMAETINNHDIDEDICKQMGQKANCNEFEATEKCKECIKQFFINKAKR